MFMMYKKYSLLLIEFFTIILLVLPSEQIFCQTVLPLGLVEKDDEILFDRWQEVALSEPKSSYAELMQDPSARLEEVQRAFNEYWKNRKLERGKGWKAYKRWEYFQRDRLMPDGTRPSAELLREVTASAASMTSQAIAQSLQSQKGKGAKTQAVQTWRSIGPNVVPSGESGAGRLNCVAFHPTNTNVIYVGAPAGGVWKTTDGGTTWSTTSDQLGSIGITDIAVHPTNTSTIFAATGDGHAGHSRSIGVVKSTDAGATWATTGLTWTTNQNVVCNRIIINPSTPQTMLLAANNGAWKTTDGGTTWTQRKTGSCKDIEFKTGDPNVVFASFGGTIWRSTNGGDSFVQLTNGLPSNNIVRAELATCSQTPRVVYAVIAKLSDYGLYGVYRSLDGGDSWSLRASTANLLGYEIDGSDIGGQGWYDLAMAVNPNDSNDVFVGGINVWRSTDGAATWSCKTMFWNGAGVPYVHADQHALGFQPSTNHMWACNDGGIYKTTNSGTNWTDRSGGLTIREVIRFGNSQSNNNLIYFGNQDCGTDLYNGATWRQVGGGDGMETIIDPTDNSIAYISNYYGDVGRTNNGGGSFTSITPAGYQGDWLTPYVIHPSNPQILYGGYTEVLKSTNRGTSWTAISTNIFGGNPCTFLTVAPSDGNIIVCGVSNAMKRTTNGGTTWTTITGTLPVSLATIRSVTIKPTDANVMWATMGGYSAGNKVFKTTDGGSTWTNISGNLPNAPALCSTFEPSSNDAVYVGTDVGVYYRNASSSNWTAFDIGLPNCPVSELEILATPKLIRAATFGRGIWENGLYNPVPVADFTANTTTICAGDTVTFTDASVDSPNGRTWTFTGGSPATSTVNSPKVSYATAGSYAVKLVAVGTTTSDSVTRTAYIRVNAKPTPAIGSSSRTACAGDSIVLDGGSGYRSYRWSTLPRDTNRRLVLKATGVYSGISLTVVDTNGCSGSISLSQALTINSLPISTTTPSGSQTICRGDTLNVSAPSGMSRYRWSNGDTSRVARVTSAGSVSVVVTNAEGCSSVSASLNVVVLPGPMPEIAAEGSTRICEGTSVRLRVMAEFRHYEWSNGDTTEFLTVAKAGRYTVTVTDNDGCKRTSNAIVIEVIPFPEPEIQSSGALVFCVGDSVILSAPLGYATYLWSNNATTRTITVKSSGAYFCSVSTSENQCVGISDTVIVSSGTTLKPLIAVNGTTRLCQGDSVILDAGAGYASYMWSNGARTRTIVVRTSGTYYVDCATRSGCSGRSDNTTVTVSSSAAIPTISNSGDTLTSSPAVSYQWYRNNTAIANAISRSYITRQSGSYTVKTSDENGCTGTSFITLIVTDVEENSIDALIKATCSPNPTDESSTLSITVEKPVRLAIDIVDMEGRVVQKIAEKLFVGTTNHTIDLRGIAVGTYLIQVSAQGETVLVETLIKR